MCRPRAARVFVGMQGCGCGCVPLNRGFFSAKEEKECLEAYMDQLQKELAGVEERIEDLKKK